MQTAQPWISTALATTALAIGCSDVGRSGGEGGPGGIASLGDAGDAAGTLTGDGPTEGGPGEDGDGPGDDGPGGGDGGDGGGPLLDVADGDGTGGADDCGVGYGFSIIWIANTYEGTVSKIDTTTLTELGRYRTDPAPGQGLPSRTSVNLVGDVAVTNRQPGGVTKIANLEANCVDADGDGAITTSTGANDVLPWGADECVLWHTPIPTQIYEYGARPTAWEAGALGEDPCEVAVQPRLWVAFKDEDDDHGIVWRLDGTTGAVLDEVDLGVWSPEDDFGPYGGAVRPDGDLVLVGKGDHRTVIVDADTLQYDDLPIAQDACHYGMGLDGNGDLWVGDKCGKVRFFDFGSGAWTEIDDVGGERVNGIQVDRDGNVWGAGSEPCRLVRIDAATRNVIDDAIPLPGCDSPWGISIDGEGFVWVVDRGAGAYKVDPATYVTQKFSGLSSPYSYSDMTGFALGLVADPPG